jgi:hypothetical protein
MWLKCTPIAGWYILYREVTHLFIPSLSKTCINPAAKPFLRYSNYPHFTLHKTTHSCENPAKQQYRARNAPIVGSPRENILTLAR